MKTAVEYLEETLNSMKPMVSGRKYELEKLMIEFAKMHVQEALKQASENAETEEYVVPGVFYVNKESVINAYSLENIK